MNRLFELIVDQIESIEKHTKRDVLINDQYSFLRKTKLSSLASYNRYHLNQFCLFAKSNMQIYHHCHRFKRKLLAKSETEKKLIKSTCFCGVVEYIVPIIVNDIFFGTVSVAGFKGEILPRQKGNLAKRLNVPLEKFENIYETLVDPDDEKLLIHEINLLAYLIENFAKKDAEVLNISVKKNQISNTYVTNALDFIVCNFNKDISVTDVANASFVSTSYLQSLFSKYVGRSVSEEITLRRIENAKELLSTTEYPIKYIAFECGFESSEYFSVVFKKVCGITPLKFRKQNKIKTTV